MSTSSQFYSSQPRKLQEGRGHAESASTLVLIELAVTLLGSEMILVED